MVTVQLTSCLLPINPSETVAALQITIWTFQDTLIHHRDINLEALRPPSKPLPEAYLHPSAQLDICFFSIATLHSLGHCKNVFGKFGELGFKCNVCSGVSDMLLRVGDRKERFTNGVEFTLRAASVWELLLFKVIKSHLLPRNTYP